MKFSQYLNEITRLSRSDFSGGKDAFAPKDSKKGLKALPGGSGLLYSIDKDHGELTVNIWDPSPKLSTDKPKRAYGEFRSDYEARLQAWEEGKTVRTIIGQLILTYADGFPLKNSVQVNTITVDEDYRGIGLAKALYGIVLTVLKYTLVSGDSQTPGGRKNWVSLSKIPGVNMKGFIAIDKDDLAKDAEGKGKMIDVIMGALGGDHIGTTIAYEYFAFDVKINATQTELEAYVKQKLAKVYSSGGEPIGLFATFG